MLFGVCVYGTCDLSLDEMLSIDWQRKYSNHENIIIRSILIFSLINLTHLPQIFSLTVYIIANTISHFAAMLCLSHTLSFCLSAVFLSPRTNCFDIKTLPNIFNLSLISINWFEPHHCFTKRLLTIGALHGCTGMFLAKGGEIQVLAGLGPSS
jgi:hypothetical protein